MPILRIVALLVAALSCQPVCLAGCAKVSQAVCDKLLRVTDYTVPPPDQNDIILAGLGFDIDKRPKLWDRLAPLQKWETAYLSAERGTVSGGALMMDGAARQLAGQYQSAKSLRRYMMPGLGSMLQPLTFARSEYPVYSLNAPPDVKMGLLAISEYCGSVVGGVWGVLRDQFGLSDEQSYDTIVGSAGQQQALERGLELVPERERLPRLRNIVDTFETQYQSAHSARSLGAFRIKDRVIVASHAEPHVPNVESARGKFWKEFQEDLLKAAKERLR